jgi:hypothetical protein
VTSKDHSSTPRNRSMSARVHTPWCRMRATSPTTLRASAWWRSSGSVPIRIRKGSVGAAAALISLAHRPISVPSALTTAAASPERNLSMASRTLAPPGKRSHDTSSSRNRTDGRHHRTNVKGPTHLVERIPVHERPNHRLVRRVAFPRIHPATFTTAPTVRRHHAGGRSRITQLIMPVATDSTPRLDSWDVPLMALPRGALGAGNDHAQRGNRPRSALT